MQPKIEGLLFSKFSWMHCILQWFFKIYCQVEQSLDGVCADAASYCGIKDRLWPDQRSMGYPFDRMGRTGVETLEEFLTPNMAIQDVTIRFSGQTVLNPRNPPANN